MANHLAMALAVAVRFKSPLVQVAAYSIAVGRYSQCVCRVGAHIAFWVTSAEIKARLRKCAVVFLIDSWLG